MLPVFYPKLVDNFHLGEILNHFGEISVDLGDLPDVSLLFLCFTNRSGSNWFGDALVSTGAFNRPEEFLNGESVVTECRLWGCRTFGEWLKIQFTSRAKNGCIALKVAMPYLEVLGEAGILNRYHGRISHVYLERDDRLDQAISYSIALQNGAWTSEMEPGNAAPVYDRQAVTRLIEDIAEQNRQFDRYFAYNGIVPVHLRYEQLVEDVAGAVTAVGHALGMEGVAMDPSKMRLCRQRSELNAEWRARFLAGE